MDKFLILTQPQTMSVFFGLQMIFMQITRWMADVNAAIEEREMTE